LLQTLQQNVFGQVDANEHHFANFDLIFQGVHQLMGSDLGPVWAENEVKVSKMVFIGIDLPKDILLQGLEQCLV